MATTPDRNNKPLNSSDDPELKSVGFIPEDVEDDLILGDEDQLDEDDEEETIDVEMDDDFDEDEVTEDDLVLGPDEDIEEEDYEEDEEEDL
jgi:hypothetical protein